MYSLSGKDQRYGHKDWYRGEICRQTSSTVWRWEDQGWSMCHWTAGKYNSMVYKDSLWTEFYRLMSLGHHLCVNLQKVDILSNTHKSNSCIILSLLKTQFKHSQCRLKKVMSTPRLMTSEEVISRHQLKKTVGVGSELFWFSFSLIQILTLSSKKGISEDLHPKTVNLHKPERKS